MSGAWPSWSPDAPGVIWEPVPAWEVDDVATIDLAPGLRGRGDAEGPVRVDIWTWVGRVELVGLTGQSDTSGCNEMTMLTAAEARLLAAALLDAAGVLDRGRGGSGRRL